MQARLNYSLTLGTAAVAALIGCVPEGAPEVTDLVVDVVASHLTGPLTLGGGGFPSEHLEAAEIMLQGAHADDLFPLGQSYHHAYDAFVVDGTYDVSYEFGSGGMVVPLNPHAGLIEGRVVAGDEASPVDVAAISVTPAFTLNGGAFPASLYDGARFFLEPVDGGAVIYLGDSALPNDPVRIVPGTYHVLYDQRGGTISPINKRFRVRENLVMSSSHRLDINVVASSLRVDFTLNGSPFPVSEYNDATFSLRDPRTGAESVLKNSHDPSTNVVAIDGSYDVIYRHETGTQVPLNTAAVIVKDFVLSSGGALHHDVVAVAPTVTVRHNGGAFPVSEYQDGVVSLYDPRTDTDTVLGNTHSPFGARILIPGTYDVLYSHESGDQVPQNRRGVVASNVTIQNGPLLVDVKSVRVEAAITLDGEPFPVSEYDDATFVLVGPAGTEEIVVGNSHDQAPAAIVMPGTYDLYYRHESGTQVPANGNFRMFTGHAVVANTILYRDLETRRVRLSATLNGEPFPGELLNSASIYARSREGDDVLLLRTHGIQSTAKLIVGDYELFYAHTAGAIIPRNPWAKVGEAAVGWQP